jgi:hypothetical protein
MQGVHIFPEETSGEIYDITQTSDKIHDGDILVCVKDNL